MADEFTENYGLFLPKGADNMGNVRQSITNSFEKLSTRNNITVIAADGALPQAGNYELGDRVFRNDDPGVANKWPSNYILVCKDENWGWHWRPIQQLMSPWVDVPATAIEDTANFELHPTWKWQIALDKRGWCHWRGAIRKKVAGITANSTYNVLKFLPLGLRPPVDMLHTLAISPVRSATGKAGNVSGRHYFRTDGYNSMRFANTDNGVSQVIWFSGFKCNTAYHWYYNG